jgi:hypothetical protein
VEVVQKKDKSCTMYHLACNAGVLDMLYHPSYMTCNSNVLVIEDVINEWMGLSIIKERKAATSMSIVGDQ